MFITGSAMRETCGKHDQLWIRELKSWLWCD